MRDLGRAPWFRPFPGKHFTVFFVVIHLLILFLAVLGLSCCTLAFCSCGQRGPLLIAVHRPLFVLASLVAEHRPQGPRHRLQ